MSPGKAKAQAGFVAATSDMDIFCYNIGYYNNNKVTEPRLLQVLQFVVTISGTVELQKLPQLSGL